MTFALPTPEELTELRLKLHANGFRPVPVKGAHITGSGAGKAPPLASWNTICRSADTNTISKWSTRYRDATNTGLLTANLIGVDIDVLDESLSANLEHLALTRLGPTPLRRIGLAPKILLAYRSERSFPKLQTPDLYLDLAPETPKLKVEVLAEGQQFVGYGIHPITMEPYYWPQESPLDVALADLPVVDQAELAAFAREAEDTLRAAGAKTKKEHSCASQEHRESEKKDQKAERSGRRAGKFGGSARPTREEIEHALSFVSNQLDYDDWIRVGFALYDGLGENGRGLWEQWSARSSKNNPDETSRRWPSFAKPRKVTIATLFYYAKEGGWRRPGSHEQAQAEASRSNDAAKNDLPTIKIAGGNLPAVVSLAEQAMMDASIPLYQRGSVLVRPIICRIQTARKNNIHTINAVRLSPVRVHHVVELMTRAAHWERFSAKSEAWVPINAPKDVAETYLAREGLWEVPELTGIINCPTLRPDGTVIDQPGYDRETALLYDPRGATFSPIEEHPDISCAREALLVLKQLIATFPFVNDEDKSVVLSGILTALIRRSLPTAPMHALTAPAAGTGKSLLVDLASVIADGRRAAPMAISRNEEESEKRLAAALIAGDTLINIDNVEYPLSLTLANLRFARESAFCRVRGYGANYFMVPAWPRH